MHAISNYDQMRSNASFRFCYALRSRLRTAERLSTCPVFLYTLMMWRAVVYLIPRSMAMLRTEAWLEKTHSMSVCLSSIGT